VKDTIKIPRSAGTTWDIPGSPEAKPLEVPVPKVPRSAAGCTALVIYMDIMFGYTCAYNSSVGTY